MVKRGITVKYKNISSTFPALDKCSGDLFNKEEKEYFYPLITSWAGSDFKAATWLKNEKIAAFDGKTCLEFCRNNRMDAFFYYIRHIEYGGFA
jgi:hypothetical protein